MVTFRSTLATPVSHMPSLFANGLFWMSVACCAVAQIFIIRSVRGARYVPEPTATVPRSRHAVEMLWAVLPAVGLVVLLAFTWRAIQSNSAAKSPDAGTSVTGPAT
jgi:heme/copper-type cytochrome/quinol oxidase subunit 2